MDFLGTDFDFAQMFMDDDKLHEVEVIIIEPKACSTS